MKSAAREPKIGRPCEPSTAEAVERAAACWGLETVGREDLFTGLAATLATSFVGGAALTNSKAPGCAVAQRVYEMPLERKYARSCAGVWKTLPSHTTASTRPKVASGFPGAVNVPMTRAQTPTSATRRSRATANVNARARRLRRRGMSAAVAICSVSHLCPSSSRANAASIAQAGDEAS
jgi:hypothetical protein